MQFSLFGFPTRIEASFVLIVALLGLGGPPGRLILWVVLAVLGILGHELGHALAARMMGARATITLAGLGGLTRSVRAVPLSRRESAVLTAAGPAAGVVLGLGVLGALHGLGWEPWTTGGWALRTGVWTTLGWSALNLVPVLPLDGGSLLELALPGRAEERRRRAAQASVAIAGAAALAAYSAGLSFAALFAMMLAGQNLGALKQARVNSSSSEPGPSGLSGPSA